LNPPTRPLTCARARRRDIPFWEIEARLFFALETFCLVLTINFKENNRMSITVDYTILLSKSNLEALSKSL
jgi:hypothetical protein